MDDYSVSDLDYQIGFGSLRQELKAIPLLLLSSELQIHLSFLQDTSPLDDPVYTLE